MNQTAQGHFETCDAGKVGDSGKRAALQLKRNYRGRLTAQVERMLVWSELR